MKKRYLVFIMLAVMSCGSKASDEEISILDDSQAESVTLAGFSFRIPKKWKTEKISETGVIAGVEVKILDSFTNREMVINASSLKVKEDTGLKSLDGYFYAVSQAFSESEANLSQTQINDISVKSIRLIDEGLVILKSVFYEKTRGVFQLDFIFPVDSFDKYSQMISDIVSTIK